MKCVMCCICYCFVASTILFYILCDGSEKEMEITLLITYIQRSQKSVEYSAFISR